ncbi:helix-turn-helix domain-containing protein [uncultured Tateyamaria sp.]|uniref:helix-turn-helix domain-containing protein n=1 Tax=uncultured Tateyamaria sp. TaxID=455651 RepID=UPI00260C7635|nr:AraC family transcriptional regulator [uncultured Tateyamaria sp.]
MHRTQDQGVKSEQFLEMLDSLDNLIVDGRIDVEANTIHNAPNMQAGRFTARPHASRIKLSKHVTLIHATDCEGHLKARLDGKPLEHDVASGLLYFIPPKVMQEYEFDGLTRNTLITLDADIIQRVIDENPEFRNASVEEPRFPFRNPRMARKMDILMTLVSRQDMGWRSLSDACNVQIAVELLKTLSNGSSKTVKPLARVELGAVRDYVQAHLEGNVGLEDASALLQRDIYGFGRAFKAATGQTFHQYLTRMRVDKARHLLTETTMPLIEIAYACGFSSQAHLTTVMGRHLGLTPGVIRQQARS